MGGKSGRAKVWWFQKTKQILYQLPC
jgi:hypothetical protein